MKEISKLFFVAGICMSVFSCKSVKVVSFENEKFERFWESAMQSPNFYYCRVNTLTYVSFVFFDFSNENDSDDLTVDSFSIFDDAGVLMFSKENFSARSLGKSQSHMDKGYDYRLYIHELGLKELNSSYMDAYRTEYLKVVYEIRGKRYEEKHIRKEETQFLWRT